MTEERGSRRGLVRQTGATGVAAAAHDRVLVAACDMPFLRAPALRLLVERAAGYDAVVPRVGDDLETLHALYSKACL
uniref:NTP transferase domain-containing protein n=1 Tax=Acinetobacter baumannii TaxID=470 RepID=UPI003395041A